MIVLDGNTIFLTASSLLPVAMSMDSWRKSLFLRKYDLLGRRSTSEMSSKKASKSRGYSLELEAVQGIVSRNRKEPKFTSDDKLRMT